VNLRTANLPSYGSRYGQLVGLLRAQAERDVRARTAPNHYLQSDSHLAENYLLCFHTTPQPVPRGSQPFKNLICQSTKQ
jgi:hypothetical protein